MQNDSLKNFRQKKSLPAHLKVERGETQKDVNTTVLKELVNRFDTRGTFKAMDMPCGDGSFLNYIHTLFPNTELSGADIVLPARIPDKSKCYTIDLTKDFDIPKSETFDLITSISGVMMFGNTQNFIENCSNRLKKDGLFVLTNDNSSTIIDRLAFLFLGRHRQFPLLHESDHGITQNLSLQELIRLLRIYEFEVTKVEFTSFYLKDLKYLPIALLVAPFQYLYVKTLKSSVNKDVIGQMFGFKQLFYKHYIIYAKKK